MELQPQKPQGLIALGQHYQIDYLTVDSLEVLQLLLLAACPLAFSFMEKIQKLGLFSKSELKKKKNIDQNL